MGLGNGNAKSGNKGSNFSFEHRNLLSLGNIATFVGAGATEATLQSVLAAIQNGSEFEARLVEDSDAPAVTWLEVRTWNTSLGSWNPPLYYPAGSNTPGAPVLPVTYINNSSVLALIESNTSGINLEATQLLVKGVLDAIKLDTANLDVALSTISSEATLLLTNGLLATIDAVLDAILLDTTAILADTNTLSTGAARSVASVVHTGAGAQTTTAGIKGVIITCVNGVESINGVVRPQGVYTFEPQKGEDTLAAIPLNANASGKLIVDEIS